MNLRLIFSVIFLLLGFASFSQNNLRIKVESDSKEVLDKIQYEKIIGRERQTNIGFNKLLQELYKNGYLETRLDSIEEKDSLTTAHFFVGQPYQWIDLKKGNIPEGVLSEIGYREHFFREKDFNPEEVSRLFEKLINYYENNGFPFIQAKLKNVQIDSSTISAELGMEKGPLITIDNFFVKGSSLISEKYVQTYISIKPGDIYNQSVINQINQRIKEIVFITEIKSSEIVFKKDKADVYLYLGRQKASQFNGVIGILPNDQTGKINVTGDVQLRLKNGLNKGELIDFNWRKLQPLTQDLTFNFNLPFIMNSSFGTDYRFKLYKRDSTFIEVNNDFSIQYYLKGNNYVKLFLKNISINVIDTNVYVGKTILPDLADTRTIVYGLGLRKWKLDYRLNPRKGYRIVVNGGVGVKRIFKADQLDQQLYDGVNLKSNQYHADFQGEVYLPVGKRFTLKIGNKSALMHSDNMFVNEMFRIGGIKTLRGFDEESIRASLYSISTIEYRFLLDQNSNLFVFAEGGYYENRNVTQLNTDFPIGFGSGLSFQTGLGIFSINYALGQQQGNPINFNSSKIHFGFVNYF